MMRSLKQTLKRNSTIGPILEKLRGCQQEYLAAKRLAHYREEAERRRIVCPTGDALVQLLRQRLAGRRRGREPVAKGQMHVFLAYYKTNWEFILPKALEPFGEVSPFEWRAMGIDDNAPDWPKGREELNAKMLAAFEEANRRRPVDAVVGYLSGRNTLPKTLQAMSSAGAAIFNFCWDDKLRFPGEMLGGQYSSPAAIAHTVDLNLTNAPDSVLKYAVHGGLGMFWPEAAHPELHKPYDLPLEFDVSFVGGRYGWRPRFIEALQKRGIKIECFGPGWPNGPLSDEDLVKLYSRSRISLGFAGIGHSKKLMCLKGRDFEAPLSGALYLTQHNPELALVYDIGREIETYTDLDDCERKIKALLADPARMQAMRKAGYRRAMRDHTYEVRWTQVFEMAGLLRDSGGRNSASRTPFIGEV